MSISVCGNLIIRWNADIPISLEKENDLSNYIMKRFNTIEELEAYIDLTPTELRREDIYVKDKNDPYKCSQHKILYEMNKENLIIHWVIIFVENYYVKLEDNVYYAHIPTLTVYIPS